MFAIYVINTDSVHSRSCKIFFHVLWSCDTILKHYTFVCFFFTIGNSDGVPCCLMFLMPLSFSVLFAKCLPRISQCSVTLVALMRSKIQIFFINAPLCPHCTFQATDVSRNAASCHLVFLATQCDIIYRHFRYLWKIKSK